MTNTKQKAATKGAASKQVMSAMAADAKREKAAIDAAIKVKQKAAYKAIMKNIRADIDDSTIGEEMKLMYLMAGATMCITEDVRMRIGRIYRAHGMEATENEMLKGLNDFCRSIKQAGYHYYNRVDNQIIMATWGIGRKDEEYQGNIEAYDAFSADQMELCRLIMLYVDRTAKNNEAFAKVFRTLRKLESTGMFKDEDIARFKQK